MLHLQMMLIRSFLCSPAAGTDVESDVLIGTCPWLKRMIIEDYAFCK